MPIVTAVAAAQLRSANTSYVSSGPVPDGNLAGRFSGTSCSCTSRIVVSDAADVQAGAIRPSVDAHGLPVADLAREQLLREPVADGGLHQPAQRARTVERVEAVEREPFA